MRVIILDNRNNGSSLSGTDGCSECCGADWSSHDTMLQARQMIKDRFGDGVELEYVDFAAAEGNGISGHLYNMIRTSQSPALVVDGKLRISGHFDIRQLLDVIEAEMEVKRGHKL